MSLSIHYGRYSGYIGSAGIEDGVSGEPTVADGTTDFSREDEPMEGVGIEGVRAGVGASGSGGEVTDKTYVYQEVVSDFSCNSARTTSSNV